MMKSLSRFTCTLSASGPGRALPMAKRAGRAAVMMMMMTMAMAMTTHSDSTLAGFYRTTISGNIAAALVCEHCALLDSYNSQTMCVCVCVCVCVCMCAQARPPWSSPRDTLASRLRTLRV